MENSVQRKKKALFATPLPAIADIANKSIAEIGLDCEVVSDVWEEIEKKVKANEYLLIISHGDYAHKLRALTSITVLEVRSDIFSVLNDISILKKQGSKKIYVIFDSHGFNFEFPKMLISGVEIYILKSNSKEDLVISVGEAILAGADGIVGPLPALNYVTDSKIFKCPLSVSEIGLKRIFEASQRILHLEKIKRLQLTRLDLIINNISEGIVIFNLSREAVFHNVQADRIMHGISSSKWYEIMAPLFKKTSDVNSVVILNGKQVLMHTQHFVFTNTDIDNHVVILHEGQEIEKSERSLRSHNISKGLIAKTTFSSLIACDPKTLELVKRAEIYAKTESNILICGETGVGKEMFAQSIHNASARKAEAFVSVNCAVLPPSLIESELFGYVEGAFTGARSKGKKGLFELAHKGTIFLDEIGELPLDVQSRLLRVLQEREVMRIGDDRVIPVDVRIICATNRHLWELSSEGKFRLDLYYRINVLRLRILPLSQRKGDIIPLFERYLESFFGNRDFTITKEAQEFILSWPWPGNVRELRNVAEASVLDGNIIKLSTLKKIMWLGADSEQKLYENILTENHSNLSTLSEFKSNEEGIIVKPENIGSLKDLERQFLEKMLESMSQDEVCQRFNISRVTLWRKLRHKI